MCKDDNLRNVFNQIEFQLLNVMVLFQKRKNEMPRRVKEEERIEMIIRGLLKEPDNRRCINCNSLVLIHILVLHFFREMFMEIL